MQQHVLSPFVTVDDELYRLRHSLAHLLAMAMQELFPGTKLGFGPPIEEGFYYDFILPRPISEEDFPAIEKTMRRMIQQNLTFTHEDLSLDEAYAQIEKMGEPYKREYAEELVQKQELKQLSFYRSGHFVDMCEGPHVESTNKIRPDCFKLRSVAGAYWRGDSKNAMMTRIYAWAFKTKEDLNQHIKNYELSLQRDHKKLGKELDLFFIDEVVGKGLPMWTPKGTVIREELEKLMKNLEFKARYQRVSTPQLARAELYYQTGHLPYYAQDMYPFMHVGEEGVEEEKYCLRPMNCPHHHRIFANSQRSYRDLPLRLAEFGQVYRYEDSGTLSGLLRVRGFCQNDAHIYCRPDQAIEEFKAVIDMHREVYKILGIEDYYIRLSCWDPEDPKGKEKYINDPAGWEQAEEMIRQACRESQVKFIEVKGEAAFYGPKMDFQIRSVTGREATASTNQLDFGIGKRLNLVYTDADNLEHNPLIIHRAVTGSHERFVAFLIEHYGGAFPLWLAPLQVGVIAVSEKFEAYAEEVVESLRGEMVRAELDKSPHSLNKKIRTLMKQKVPYLLIIGEKEMQARSVNVRRRGSEAQEEIPLEEFMDQVLSEIKSRSKNEDLV